MLSCLTVFVQTRVDDVSSFMLKQRVLQIKICFVCLFVCFVLVVIVFVFAQVEITLSKCLRVWQHVSERWTHVAWRTFKDI